MKEEEQKKGNRMVHPTQFAHQALLVMAGVLAGSGGLALGQYFFARDPVSKKVEVWVTDLLTNKKTKLSQEQIQTLFNSHQDLQQQLSKLESELKAQKESHHQEIQSLKAEAQSSKEERESLRAEAQSSNEEIQALKREIQILSEQMRAKDEKHIANTDKILALVGPTLFEQQAMFTFSNASSGDSSPHHFKSPSDSDDYGFQHVKGGADVQSPRPKSNS
ncbi:hypothetical protein EBR43_08525 [bacterium]|nr:hypothetical protein [bacterium]NBW57813.1 hypothetical protein [bacterium]